MECGRLSGKLMRSEKGAGRNTEKSGRFGNSILLRPRSYWSVIVYHLPLAVISGTALSLPYVTTPRNLPMISCTFLRLTGMPCPFCGFTRSFWAVAAGDWGSALINCPLAPGVYLFTVVLFVWNAFALICGVVLLPGPLFRLAPVRRRSVVGVICGLFFLNWVYRLVMGLK